MGRGVPRTGGDEPDMYQDLHEDSWRVPRTGGDEPSMMPGYLHAALVFPAQAGMNRPSLFEALPACVPRTGGDEPVMIQDEQRYRVHVFPAQAGMNRTMAEDNRSWAQCSPHRRG